MTDVEIRIELARLDERLKALVREIARAESVGKEAVNLAASELSRRLDVLNHAHQEALRVQGTYVSQEVDTLAKKELDSRIRKLENLSERMWFPMVVVASTAAGIAAAVMKLIVH